VHDWLPPDFAALLASLASQFLVTGEAAWAYLLCLSAFATSDWMPACVAEPAHCVSSGELNRRARSSSLLTALSMNSAQPMEMSDEMMLMMDVAPLMFIF